MTTGMILLDTKRPMEFDEAAKTTLDLLHLDHGMKRYSVNYAGGEYIVTEALGLKVKFYFADEEDFPDYPYMLSLSVLEVDWARDYRKLDDISDIVARCLASHGMRAARFLGITNGSPMALYEGERVWTTGD